MTKKEFMILTGKSRGQTDKLTRKGKFMVNGFGWFVSSKTGAGKTAPIEITKVINQPAVGADNKNDPGMESAPAGVMASCPGDYSAAGADDTVRMSQLKMVKMSVEIKRLNQQIHETSEDIEKKYAEELIDAILSSLQPLKEVFAKCQLNKKQTDMLNGALTASLDNVEASLMK